MSFVAITKVKFPNELKSKIHSVGLAMLPIAKPQPGFISIGFHQSNDRNETMMYWEWESEANYKACMQSPDWALLMERHSVLFASDGVEFLIDTYERLA